MLVLEGGLASVWLTLVFLWYRPDHGEARVGYGRYKLKGLKTSGVLETN
jgi:hypothetical protein